MKAVASTYFDVKVGDSFSGEGFRTVNGSAKMVA